MSNRETNPLGIGSCGGPLCSEGDHHPLCRATQAPAPQSPADAAPAWDTDATKRLRSIVDLLGLHSAVPEGDLTGYEFAVLGFVRRKIEQMNAKAAALAVTANLQALQSYDKACEDYRKKIADSEAKLSRISGAVTGSSNTAFDEVMHCIDLLVDDDTEKYCHSARAALAQRVGSAEPVAYIDEGSLPLLVNLMARPENASTTIRVHNRSDKFHGHSVALHTAPQPLPALTDEQIKQVERSLWEKLGNFSDLEFARAILAAAGAAPDSN